MSPALPRNLRRTLYIAGLAIALAMGGVTVFFGNATQRRVQVAKTLANGDPDAAPQVIRRYGCAGCHTIPGIAGADGKVGGDLTGIRKRVYLAGVLNNSNDNLIRWLVSPQSFAPHSAMPSTGISESEARDVAAYLYAADSD